MTEAFIIVRISSISQKPGKEKGKTNNKELKTIARWQLSIPSLLFKWESTIFFFSIWESISLFRTAVLVFCEKYGNVINAGGHPVGLNIKSKALYFFHSASGIVYVFFWGIKASIPVAEYLIPKFKNKLLYL